MKVINLIEKWTVSKGRNSYGYNICTLWEQKHFDGKTKVARCNGGGYDMQGACLGEYLTNCYQDRLQELYKSLTASGDIKTENNWSASKTYYGLHKNSKGKIYCDGACGRSCMEIIGKAIDLEGFNRLKVDTNTSIITIYDQRCNNEQ